MKLRSSRNKYWNQSRWEGLPNTEKPLFGSQLYYIQVGLYYVNSVKSSLGHKLIVGLQYLCLPFAFLFQTIPCGDLGLPLSKDRQYLPLLFWEITSCDIAKQEHNDYVTKPVTVHDNTDGFNWNENTNYRNAIFRSYVQYFYAPHRLKCTSYSGSL